MLFDTHAHYDDRKFDEDRDTLLSSMKENGVGWVVNAGCGVDSTRRGITLAEKYDFCYLTAGIHPNQAEDMNDGYSMAVQLKETLWILDGKTYRYYRKEQ